MTNLIRLIALLAAFSLAAADKPNFLLLPVDDLNDWIGCLGGHPQAKTPNMDRLAQRGVLFANAHCQSPVCNPSRASLGISLYPSTTGIYFLNPDLSASPQANAIPTFPHHFDQNGYAVSGAGKLFHGGSNKKHLPNWAGSFGGMGPLPKKKIAPFKGHRLWDWGAYPARDEDTPDHKIASWGIAELAKQKVGKPFMITTGFYRPHVPHFAPQKWLDMFPLDEVKLPKIAANDLDDLSQYAINLTRLKHVAPTHEWVTQNDQWKPLVQTYLACVTFTDHQVGRMLDALDASPHKDNTYVILFTDHGFHLGEKDRWAKRSLWEDSTRVPMIIAGPGIAAGKTCTKPVELIDLYPTLLELADLTAPAKLEGDSLVPLLKNPAAHWPHLARTEFGPDNYSLRSERYRYIHYADGSEEFYDHAKDPHEWQNQITNPEYAALIKQHRAHKPKSHAPILGKGSTGHAAFTASAPKDQ